jgi:hypothetical protein
MSATHIAGFFNLFSQKHRKHKVIPWDGTEAKTGLDTNGYPGLSGFGRELEQNRKTLELSLRAFTALAVAGLK